MKFQFVHNRTSKPQMAPIVVIYDLETSGFAPFPTMSPRHKILQICACRIDNGKTFDSYVNPGMHDIPPQSTAIHRITKDKVENCKDIAGVIEEMIDTLDLRDQDVELIAHNNDFFDELVLKKEFKGLPPGFTFWDTLPFLRKAYPKLASYKLERLHKYFYNSDLKDAHNAIADVLALARIYKDHIAPLREQYSKEDPYKSIRENCLVNIHMVGDWRAILIVEALGLETVSQLQAYFKTLVVVDRYAIDRFLVDNIPKCAVNQRIFIIAHILDMKPCDPRVLYYVKPLSNTGGCLDPVDYYVKYRYFLNRKPKRRHLYEKGMMMIKNQ